MNTKRESNGEIVFRSKDVLPETADYRTEKELTLVLFKELMEVFQKTANKSGNVGMEEFTLAFKHLLGQGLSTEQMNRLFMQMDANTDNLIDWNDFSTFMLMRAQGRKAISEVTTLI
jgi:Ca2+-binding EF-hand superfamily protein